MAAHLNHLPVSLKEKTGVRSSGLVRLPPESQEWLLFIEVSQILNYLLLECLKVSQSCLGYLVNHLIIYPSIFMNKDICEALHLLQHLSHRQ